MTLAIREAVIRESPLTHWDSRWKLAAFVLAIFGIAAIQALQLAVVSWLLAVLIAILGKVPLATIRDRQLLLLLAVLPVLIIVPLTYESPQADEVPEVLRISPQGLGIAATVAFRAMAIGTLVLVILRTGRFSQTLAAAYALGVPGRLIQITQLAYRYLFLLAAEARRTMIALRCRGFRPSTSWQTYHTLAQAIGGLLIRGGERADRVALAMICRGYDGRFRSVQPFQTRPADLLGFLAVTAIVVVLLLLDRQRG